MYFSELCKPKREYIRFYKNSSSMLKSLKIYGLFALLAVSSSCFREPEFPLQPSIEFESITKEVRLDAFQGVNKDSITIGVRFRDGDGDLGLSDAEIDVAQRNQSFNYLIEPFRKVRGSFQPAQTAITLNGFYPRLKIEDKPAPLEGVLYYSIDYPHPFTPANDTLKFLVQIKDRAGNLSNQVETTEIVLNVRR